MSNIIATMTEANGPDTVVTAIKIARTEARHLIDNTRTKNLAKLDAIKNAVEGAHKKALNRISNAKEWDGKTPTNATAEGKGRQTKQPSPKTGTKGERSKSHDYQTQD